MIDDFTRAVIRRKIHDFYSVKKTVPTLRNISKVLEEEDILHCSTEYLRKTLKQLGFRWAKCMSKRKILIEKPEIVSWRIQYLRNIRRYRQSGRKIIYLDETYVHATQSKSFCWQSEDEPGVTEAIGKGPRLNIIHAGGEDGFVPNALRIWQSNKKTEDYHSCMNFENFSLWVMEALLPNIPQNSVIILDNASYHNKEADKTPTLSSRKDDIKEWLMRNNVSFTEEMTKCELLMRVKTVGTKKTYAIDEVITSAGHIVIRLPPYHPDLNPIELVWGDIKGRVSECLSESLHAKKQLCITLFSEFAADKWKNCCKHVYKIEDEYWVKDAIIEETVENFIISLRSDTSDPDSETTSDEDSE